MRKKEKETKDMNKKELVKSDTEKLGKADKVKQALKIRFALEQEPKVDMYYYRIYRKLRLVRYLCVLFAALFVMSVPMAYSDQITTENFKYLLKYIKLQMSEESEVYTALQYEASEHMQFGVYADDVVVCTDTALVYYDKLGNESMRISFGPYENPQLLVSDKYVMVYDRGGTEYAIYNNFKRLHHETTRYPITLCALSNRGDYAVVTSNENYISELQVYNLNFKQTGRIQRDLYFSDLFFLDDTGEYGYTGFTTDEKGGIYGEICLYTSESEKILNISVNDIPLSVSVADHEAKAVYTDRIEWYSKDGVLKDTYILGESPGAFCYSPGNLSVYMSDKSEYEFGYINVIGASSDSVITLPSNESVCSIQWDDGYFYLLGEQTIEKLDTQGNRISLTVSNGLMKLLFLPNGEIMGCYADRTELLVFS